MELPYSQDMLELLATFNRWQVQYLIVGGRAVNAYATNNKPQPPGAPMHSVVKLFPLCYFPCPTLASRPDSSRPQEPPPRSWKAHGPRAGC